MKKIAIIITILLIFGNIFAQTITAGDIIDLSNIAGNGEYAVSIRYIPSNTLIGEYAFTGHD